MNTFASSAEIARCTVFVSGDGSWTGPDGAADELATALGPVDAGGGEEGDGDAAVLEHAESRRTSPARTARLLEPPLSTG
jgi:hypothetical protein